MTPKPTSKSVGGIARGQKRSVPKAARTGSGQPKRSVPKPARTGR